MKIKQAKEYYELGVISSFQIIRDPLTEGAWLLVMAGQQGRSWTMHTALGQTKSYARLDTLIGEIESICGSISTLTVGQ